MNGDLTINTLAGTAEFRDGWGQTILRVTHLPTPVPPNVMIDLVAIRNVTSYTPITIQPDAQIVKGGQTEYERPEDYHREAREPDPDYDERCPVCTRIHTSADYTKWGIFTFITAHEYIIWTRTSQQTYAHRGRMQYMGRGPNENRYHLTFNARGPDRTHKDQYGGTQTLDARNIIKVEEVDRNPAKRYVDEIDRTMKKDGK
jgi:hypothetical protein